jgi:hypothetical protein
MSTIAIGTIDVDAPEEFGSEFGAIGVEETSRRLHNAAVAILDKAGKRASYTADEYVTAVAAARRKLGLADVHTAMAGRRSVV